MPLTLQDRHNILARLWSYVCLVPSEIAAAYTVQDRLPPERETQWLQFLTDLIEERLGEEEVQRQHAPLFDEPDRARRAMAALSRAWRQPAMRLVREQMEKDIAVLRLQGNSTAMVPSRPPDRHGREGETA